MNNSIDISKILKTIGSLFRRFHTTLFIVVIVLGLAYAVLSLNSLIATASDPNANSTNAATDTSPQQTVVERIKQLHTSDKAPDTIDLPSGRINPFSE